MVKIVEIGDNDGHGKGYGKYTSNRAKWPHDFPPHPHWPVKLEKKKKSNKNWCRLIDTKWSYRTKIAYQTKNIKRGIIRRGGISKFTSTRTLKFEFSPRMVQNTTQCSGVNFTAEFELPFRRMKYFILSTSSFPTTIASKNARILQQRRRNKEKARNEKSQGSNETITTVRHQGNLNSKLFANDHKPGMRGFSAQVHFYSLEL